MFTPLKKTALHELLNKPRLFTVMPCEVTKSHIITVF